MPAQSSNDQLIDKDGGIDPSLTYASLRTKAIELVQKFSGDTWTDFNIHDPGVTILEYLCFALSDLAYRTHFSIEDILSDKNGMINRLENYFFTKEEIFSTNPFSTDDYRKLILDKYVQVHNAWIEHDDVKTNIPNLKGFYKVLIQLAEEKEYNNGVRVDEGRVVKTGIKKLLLGIRNLGEDFCKPVFLKPFQFDIRAEVEIDRNRMPEEILAEIYAVLNGFLNPGLFFYTENELRQQNFSTEKIYNGPSLKNGFLKQEDLDKKKRAQIDPTDLTNEIAAINGVLVVRCLDIVHEKDHPDNNIYLEEGWYPDLKFDPENPGIKIIIQDEQVKVKSSLFLSMYEKKEELKKRRHLTIDKPSSGKATQDIKIAYEKKLKAGEFRNIGHYFSIQHLFPQIYKLYEDQHIPNDNGAIISSQDMAKANQLKAYLMVFEQLIADYLSQLANVSTVFSGVADTGKIKSYFTQPLFNVPGSQRIIKAITSSKDDLLSEWDFFKNNPVPDYRTSKNEYLLFLDNGFETDEDAITRRIRALDQMLARFNFTLEKFPVESFTGSYFPDSNIYKDKAMLQWKAAFLKNIADITMNRNQAFNYYQDPGKGNFVKIQDIPLGGFEKKMNYLLFIVDPENFNPDGKAFSVENPLFTISSKRRLLSHYFNTGAITIVENNDNSVNETTEKKIVENEGLVFKKLPLSFFKSALSVSNYRISLNKKKKPVTFLVEHNHQIAGNADPNYEIAGEYAQSEKAAADLTRFISQLRYINVLSEGFHVVEHILLHYKQSFKKFGFNLLGQDGDVIARQAEWFTYDEREQFLNRMNIMAAQFQQKLEIEISNLKNAYALSDSNYKEVKDSYRELRSDYNKQEVYYNNNSVTYSKIINLYIELKSKYENNGEEKEKIAERYNDFLKNYKEIIENYKKIADSHKRLSEEHDKAIIDYREKRVEIIREISNSLTRYCLVANEYNKEAVRANFIVPYFLGYNFDNLEKNNKDPTALKFFKTFFLLEDGIDDPVFIDIVFEKIIKLFQLVLLRFQNLSPYNESSFLPAFQSVIKLTNEKEIPEDFFNLKMTVVLPDWTARFQNKKFRSFAEKLFIDNSPAHMRLHFKWLSIREMAEFEDIYNEWLCSINSDTHELRIIADKIVSLLVKDMY